jgi:hypothetical protein
MTGQSWTTQERAALIYLRAVNDKEQQTWNLVSYQFNCLFGTERSKVSLQSQYKYLHEKHKLNREPRAELEFLQINGMLESWMAKDWIDYVLGI